MLRHLSPGAGDTKRRRKKERRGAVAPFRDEMEQPYQKSDTIPLLQMRQRGHLMRRTAEILQHPNLPLPFLFR